MKVKTKKKSRKRKLTFILCLSCARSGLHTSTCRSFSLHVHPLVSASQMHWCTVSSLDVLCSDAPCLENTFLSLHLTALPHPQISAHSLLSPGRLPWLLWSGQYLYHRLSWPHVALFWSTDHSCNFTLLWLFYFLSLTRWYAPWQQELGMCCSSLNWWMTGVL